MMQHSQPCCSVVSLHPNVALLDAALQTDVVLPQVSTIVLESIFHRWPPESTLAPVSTVPVHLVAALDVSNYFPGPRYSRWLQV